MHFPRIITLLTTALIAAGMVVAAFIGVGPLTGVIVAAALVSVYGGAYAVARMVGGDGDIAAIVTGRHDERQGHLDNTAALLSSLTALILCGVGAIVSLARGDGSGGPFALILTASGLVYLVSLFALRSRA